MLDRFRPFAEGLDHPEGICWDPRGRVYAGGEAGQIYAVTLDGKVEEIANTGGFVLGLALDGVGRIYACDLHRHEVLRIEPESGKVETYSSGTADVPMRTPNHPTFADDGTLFVTDSGGWKADDGVIYRIAPGAQTSVWTRELHRFPNGCCMSLDGDALVVVESLVPGVSRAPIEDDGSAGPPGLLAKLGTVPDGVAFAADGSLYVSCYRPDAIYRVSPQGEIETVIEDPEGTLIAAPTNIAFGGEALDRLLVASLGRWHLTVGEIGVVGAPLRYPTVP